MADAEAGKLDPVIGRDEEIRRVIQEGLGGAGAREKGRIRTFRRFPVNGAPWLYTKSGSFWV